MSGLTAIAPARFVDERRKPAAGDRFADGVLGKRAVIARRNFADGTGGPAVQIPQMLPARPEVVRLGAFLASASCSRLGHSKRDRMVPGHCARGIAGGHWAVVVWRDAR
jgi:hypothetical protein